MLRLLTLFLCTPLLLASAQAGAQEADEFMTDANTVGTEVSGNPSASTAPSYEVPRITINGRPVVTMSEQMSGAVLESLPAELQNEGAQEALAARTQLQFYRHNPVDGSARAPLTYAEFTDLSCLQCMPLLAELEAALVSHTEVLRRVHVTLPVDKFGGTNLAAFYGKVAQENGKFWQYRQAVIELTEPTPEAFMNILLDLGIAPADVRQQILRDSRRFYRELDADLRLAQRLRQDSPPAMFLNGVPVGGAWIPLEQTNILADYELARQGF